MEDYMNYKVEETPIDPRHKAMYRKMRLHIWRHGRIGPYAYRAKVHSNRSSDLIGHGTLSELYLSDTRIEKEILKLTAFGDGNIIRESQETNFVINSIIHFYWNGPPKYTSARTSSEELESIKDKFIEYIESIEAHFGNCFSTIVDEPATHENLNRLETAFKHLLSATSSLDYMPESCLRETCEEIWENDIEENGEAGHDA